MEEGFTVDEALRVVQFNLLGVQKNLSFFSEESEKILSEWLAKKELYTWKTFDEICQNALGQNPKYPNKVSLSSRLFITKFLEDYCPEGIELKAFKELAEYPSERPKASDRIVHEGFPCISSVYFYKKGLQPAKAVLIAMEGKENYRGFSLKSVKSEQARAKEIERIHRLDAHRRFFASIFRKEVNFGLNLRTFVSEEERSAEMTRMFQSDFFVMYPDYFACIDSGQVNLDELGNRIESEEDKVEYMGRLCPKITNEREAKAHLINLILNRGCKTAWSGRKFRVCEKYDVVARLLFEIKLPEGFIALLLEGKITVTYAPPHRQRRLDTLDQKLKEAVRLIHDLPEGIDDLLPKTRNALRTFCEDQVLKVGSNEPQVSDETWDWAVEIFKGVDEYNFISNARDRIRNMRCDFESDNEEDAGAESNESLGADLEPLLSQYESHLNSALSSFSEVRAEESKQNPDRQWLETFRQVEWEQLRAREKVINDYHAGLRGLRKGFKSGRLDLEVSERRAQPPVVEPEPSTTKLSPYKDWGREVGGKELLVDNKQSSIVDRIVDDILEGRAPRDSVKGGKKSLPSGVLTSGPECADYWEAAVSFSSNLRLYYYFDSENKKIIAQVGPHLK